MRIGVFIGALCFLYSCSEPENTGQNQPSPQITSDSFAVPEKKPFYSSEFKQAVLWAISKGYVPLDPDTFTLIPPYEHFSLVNPAAYFNGQQSLYIGQSESVRVSLIKDAVVVMEERTFLSQEDLGSIQGALTRKLEDPRIERFLRRPFTYWQYKLALCHIFTDQERDRGKMDEIYNEWTRLQTPKE